MIVLHRLTQPVLLFPSIFANRLPAIHTLGPFPPSTLRSASPKTNAHLDHTRPRSLFCFQYLSYPPNIQHTSRVAEQRSPAHNISSMVHFLDVTQELLLIRRPRCQAPIIVSLP
ncbi:hypothetical protein BDQ12DRAFT_685582 [Crucibulum laeve]|uniref:Uncharacterized protein n=1 Tax=Crucibulum laeve TaxID=68775 RepID=A0A5C3LVM8_9AGAR|nr:hypothetical protein BDQ12DRAFT_685582 [Crucibulum laeve]